MSSDLIFAIFCIIVGITCLVVLLNMKTPEPKEPTIPEEYQNIHRLMIKFIKGAESLNLLNNVYYYASRTNRTFLVYKRHSDIEPLFQCSLDEVKGFIKVSDLQRKNVSLGKAVVGGVLFGPAGALLGGAMGKKTADEQYLLVISTKTADHALVFEKSQYLNVKRLLPGKEVYSMNVLESKPEPHSSLSITEELEKLVALKEKGVLTDEEFEKQKQKLLNSN